MLEKWFETIQLPISIEQYHKLPQNWAYKYEDFRNQAWLTPRPKNYHALLNLEHFASPIELAVDERVAMRPLDEADSPIEAKAADALHDGIHAFDVFLGRVGA